MFEFYKILLSVFKPDEDEPFRKSYDESDPNLDQYDPDSWESKYIYLGVWNVCQLL